jgi:fatty-acyl-CoA synthase
VGCDGHPVVRGMWGIWHWLERQADLRPDKIALVDDAEKLSYRALRDRVASLAAALEAMGVAAGDRAAILSWNRAEYVEVLFACARRGAMAVPLNWRLTPDELAYQLADSEPVVLFFDPELTLLASTLRARGEGTPVRAWVAFDADHEPPP